MIAIHRKCEPAKDFAKQQPVSIVKHLQRNLLATVSTVRINHDLLV